MDLFTLVGRIVLESEEFNNKVDAAMSKAESLANGFHKAGEKVVQVGSGLTKAVSMPLTALGGVSVKTAATFEDAMLKVQSLSGATKDEYEQLSAAAKEYGATTAWTAKDVADAMGYMALAGFDTKEILASVGGMLSLASASGEDLATVTDILTDAMTALGDGAGEAARYADVLATTQAKTNTTVGMLGEAFKYVAPLAGSYGYQLEDISAALGMMANAGVKGSMAGTALSSIITRLGTNTSGARDAIEALGIQFYNSDGTARDLSDVLKDLCDATADMDTEQKAALASTVAGQDAQKGLLSVLNQGSAAYEELEGKLRSCNGTASDMAANMESGLGGSLRSLKSALEGVAITAGEKLAPYIEKAAQKIKEFTQWFQNLSPATQDTIIKMGLLLVAIGPVLTIFGKGISVIGSIISAGSKLVGGVGTVISVGSKLAGGVKTVVSVGSKLASGAKLLIGVFTGLNPVVLAVGGAIGVVVAAGVAIYKNWDKIKEKAHELGEKISQKWEEIKQWTSDLKDKVIEKWQGIKEGINHVAENLGEGVSRVWSGIKQGANALKDGIIASWQGIKAGVQAAVQTLGEGVSRAWSGIKQWSSNLKDSIVGHWQNIKEKMHTAAEAAKDIVVNKFQELKEKAGSRIEELKEGVASKFQELKEKAGNRITELKEGVVSKFQELKENASNRITELKEGVVSKFQELKEKAGSRITELKDGALAKFRELKENASNRIEELKEGAVSRFQELKEKASSRVAELKENAVSRFQELKENASNRIEELKEGAVSRFQELKENAVSRFEEMREKTISKAAEMREKVVTGFADLKEQASQKISDLKERWGQRFTDAKTKIVSEVTELKEKAISKISEFKDKSVQKFKELRDASVSSLAQVAEKGVQGFQAIRDKGGEAIKNLAGVAGDKFKEMGSSIHEKFGSVAEKITGTFSKCQEKVKGIVDAVKGFFKFEWKLPKIKLPHFKITGGFSLNPPSIPKLGVEWYAQGGIMTRPTAFGINPFTGNMMAGGEAGAEAIAPIAVLQDYIRQAVAERDQALISALTAVLNTLNRYLPQCAEKQLVLDTGATVGALAAAMNTKLGEISRQDGRIK